MKKLLVLLIVILGGLVLVGGYMGIVPGLSKIMAKQVDLGVEPDLTQVTSMASELGMEYKVDYEASSLPTAEKYSGQVEVDRTVTGQEATSIFKSWEYELADTPIKNVQVRFVGGGRVEISGIFKLSEAIMMGRRLGYSDSQIEEAKQYAGIMNQEIPFYTLGTGGASNNSVRVNPETLKAGNVTVPSGITQLVAGAVENAIERRLAQIDGLEVESLEIEDAGARFVGQLPQKVEAVR